MTASPERLPDDSFASLAFELRLVAHREAMGNEKVEEFYARYPNAMSTRVLADLRNNALLIGRASNLLSILARHEHAVRELVVSLSAPAEDSQVHAGAIPLEREVRALHPAKRMPPC
ncbi:hypothetical protein RA307_31275 [Xanthobacteraceae bacterium Astr-EGSB]|uniref:hypothetical protein n=1 Tax=Astrobacterium formosum TaxID=3069710 RepID=UPI0027B36004|nr:hypothetical protein [Xanthobacteraceae bacterium Astr-EGSB]